MGIVCLIAMLAIFCTMAGGFLAQHVWNYRNSRLNANSANGIHAIEIRRVR